MNNDEQTWPVGHCKFYPPVNVTMEHTPSMGDFPHFPIEPTIWSGCISSLDASKPL